MKVYRCCSEEEIKSYKEGKIYKKTHGRGTNTFVYDKIHYIHFFYFAECMFHYKKYTERYNKYYVEYDIPLEILKKYIGFGYYSGIIPGYYTPVPEFAIPYNEVKIEYINDITDKEKEEYLKKQEWEEYKTKLPKEYLADYEYGEFKKEYNKDSIKEMQLNKVLSKSIIAKK